ncbi:hypothetical protein BKA69DRAFT_1070116 [Paraphysoderma sedebokerense]|nr:hypothetical protein BKA69DRAFT_1070116 [Paraphysoderma sedebokerense]
MSMKPTCFSSVFLPTPISSNSPSPAPQDGMPYSAKTMSDLPDSSILNQFLNATFTSTVPMQASVKCHELKFQANDQKPEIATLPQNDQQFTEVLNGKHEEKSAEDVDFEKEMAGLIDMTQVC